MPTLKNSRRRLAVLTLAMLSSIACAPLEDEPLEDDDVELEKVEQAITSAGWSAWTKCDVNNGSDKQVRIEWMRYQSRIVPYRIQWKTNSPGIPLKPVKYITTKFGGAGGAVQKHKIVEASASGQWIYNQFAPQGTVLTETWLADKDDKHICFVEIRR